MAGMARLVLAVLGCGYALAGEVPIAADDDDYVPPPPQFDCGMRKLAFDYGRSLLPRQGGFSSLWAALDLGNTSGDCSVPASAVADRPAHRTAPGAVVPTDAVFVSASSGTDVAAGTIDNPLSSLAAAVERALGTASKTVVLRGGATHYLTATLGLTPRHSGLTITSFPGEDAVVSGGKELKVTWVAHDTSPGRNIWVADVSGQVEAVPGLQLDGVRATRARFPNLPGGIEVQSDRHTTGPSLNRTITPAQTVTRSHRNGRITRTNRPRSMQYRCLAGTAA
jgi:hypothetical protein